jgi:hypothetical protein
MPYFHINGKVNLLFIHIPKTGGTSVELFLSKHYNIDLNRESLCTRTAGAIEYYEGVSLQHQTYSTLMREQARFNLCLPGMKILTIVRNPYERLVSDLFFYHLIKKDSTADFVETVIKKYLYSGIKYTKDNHVIPQYLFLIDDYDADCISINKNIIILKQEKLAKMMHKIGYKDFNEYKNVSNTENINYFKFLSVGSICLINKFYEKDFALFGYKMR